MYRDGAGFELESSSDSGADSDVSLVELTSDDEGAHPSPNFALLSICHCCAQLKAHLHYDSMQMHACLVSACMHRFIMHRFIMICTVSLCTVS